MCDTVSQSVLQVTKSNGTTENFGCGISTQVGFTGGNFHDQNSQISNQLGAAGSSFQNKVPKLQRGFGSDTQILLSLNNELINDISKG